MADNPQGLTFLDIAAMSEAGEIADELDESAGRKPVEGITMCQRITTIR